MLPRRKHWGKWSGVPSATPRLPGWLGHRGFCLTWPSLSPVTKPSLSHWELAFQGNMHGLLCSLPATWFTVSGLPWCSSHWLLPPAPPMSSPVSPERLSSMLLCPHTLTFLRQLPRVTLSQEVFFCPEMHPKQTFQDYFPILFSVPGARLRQMSKITQCLQLRR